MANAVDLISRIDNGEFDGKFKLIYGKNDADIKFQRDRYMCAVAEFATQCGDSIDSNDEIYIFSVPGRSEVGGNHTDHNHGRVLACAVDLDIIAIVRKNNNGVIKIKSEGFDADIIDINNLKPSDGEFYKSAGLIRGICARLRELGFAIGTGFDVYSNSMVLKGSGLSSSAAFEVMVVNIFNHLYNGGKISPVTMAQVSQYAESVFFGKPCGLMDQTACAVGGFITIDFKDPEMPVIEKLDFDFSSTDHALCIVDTAGNHSDLNEDYASIQAEMRHLANILGKSFLRDCDETEFYNNIKVLRKSVGDRPVLRAMHFFGDDARVVEQARTLKTGDFEGFKKLIIESGRSSFMYLQNCYSVKEPSQQGIPLALTLSERILSGCGAWRVHGGGFAGTIQAFVPRKKLEEYTETMNEVFGDNSCHCLNIRSIGAFRLT
jgi:galactokinase